MDYKKIFKSMVHTKINIDYLLKKYAKNFYFLAFSDVEQNNLEQDILAHLVKNDIFEENRIKRVILSFYYSYAKNKMANGSLVLSEMIKSDPTLENNTHYIQLLKFMEKSEKELDDLKFDLPFIETKCHAYEVDTMTLLKSCTLPQIKFVKSALTSGELNTLYKKFGLYFDKNNMLSFEEEEKIKNIIFPKINKMINQFAGYYYYDQIFADKKNGCIKFVSFYELKSSYKRVLFDCYGYDLTSPLNENSDIETLKNMVIPRLRKAQLHGFQRKKIGYYMKYLHLICNIP